MVAPVSAQRVPHVERITRIIVFRFVRFSDAHRSGLFRPPRIRNSFQTRAHPEMNDALSNRTYTNVQSA